MDKWRVLLWDSTFHASFQKKDAISKSKLWKDQEGAESAMKRLILKYSFIHSFQFLSSYVLPRFLLHIYISSHIIFCLLGTGIIFWCPVVLYSMNSLSFVYGQTLLPLVTFLLCTRCNCGVCPTFNLLGGTLNVPRTKLLLQRKTYD